MYGNYSSGCLATNNTIVETADRIFSNDESTRNDEILESYYENKK